MSIEQLLIPLGLSTREAKTFITLLQHSNGMTILQLSKATNSPRATLYGHLSSLIQKGLVVKSLNEKGVMYFTETIDRISSLYSEHVKELQNKQKELAKELQKFRPKTFHQPKFSIYDTAESAKNIFWDVLRTRETMYWFWPVKEMIQYIPEETFAWFMQQRVIRNIKLYMLWPASQTINLSDHPSLKSQEKKESLREIKILPPDIEQCMGYGIYGTKVAFISTQREHYGFIIDSKELSDALKIQFDHFWKMSKKHTLL